MNQSPDRLVVNKALRRRAGFFGFNTGLATLSLGVITLGLLAAQFMPLNVVVAMTFALLVSTIYIFRDGTDPVLGKFRRPRHYTRGGLDYFLVFNDEKSKTR